MYLKSTLENGIRVVTKSMSAVRSVAMGVLIDAGMADEPQHKNGLAHMAEHLMFRGTGSRDSMQITRLMDEAGGQMGGFITRDYTCYTATVLDHYRTYALELLGDILLNSIFSEEDLEREKKTIISEIENGLDIPDQRADLLLKAHAWKGHYLGKSINGSPAAVRGLTREDVIYFVHSQYLPDRMIIAAAGNIEHQDFVSQVRDAFWRLIGQGGPRQSVLPGFHPGVILEEVPVSQVYFSIGLRAYPYAHPNRYAIHILNKILGGGISSRLFRRIREEKGLLYDIHSEYQAYRDDGLVLVEGSTSPDHFLPVIGQTLTEISKILNGDDPIDEEELWKAKMQIRAQHLLSAESSNTQMSRLATQELYFGDHIDSTKLLAEIEHVDLVSLGNLSGDIFSDALRNAAIAVVGPPPQGQYDASMIEALLATF